MRYEKKIPIIVLSLIGILSLFTLSTEVFADSHNIPTISVSTELSTYGNGDNVIITGNISNYDSSSQSTLTWVIISPENNLVTYGQLTPSSDGSFELSFITGGPLWKSNGDYIVEFHFGSISGETKFVYTDGDLDVTPVICASNEQLVNGVCVLKEPEPPVDKEPEPTPKLESQPDSKSIIIPAPFVDESKDPQHYIDRYDNEVNYKKWFDDNYPEYDSIYQAIGLENSKFAETFDTLESNIPEVSSQIIPGKGSSIWYGDGFTINYPTGWLYDEGMRTGSGEYRYVISFFNEQDTAQITITRVFYPDMFFTLDILYDMYDNPEKYGGQASDQSKVDNVFSFFIALELAEILQCDYNYEEDYGCADLKPKALRLFENDSGLPALQVEYSYAEKLLGDNTTYGYSVLVTKYYLQERPIVIYSDSTLNDYEQLRPYFVDAANSFTILAEDKLSDKTKTRLLSDMKSFPNSDIAKMMNDAMKEVKGYSIPIIEYGQISLETTELNSQSETKTSKGGGCLIATATYGSELAPQVQQLRELRDNQLLQTELGTNFMNSFNDFYYSFSPIIADYERANPVFKEMIKISITPMLSTLSIMNYAEDGSESQVLVLGLYVIILNLGMYVATPVFVGFKIRKFYRQRKLAS